MDADLAVMLCVLCDISRVLYNTARSARSLSRKAVNVRFQMLGLEVEC